MSCFIKELFLYILICYESLLSKYTNFVYFYFICYNTYIGVFFTFLLNLNDGVLKLLNRELLEKCKNRILNILTGDIIKTVLPIITRN